MKIICSKTDLLNGVNIVSKAVPSKTTMTILECILIDASTDVIKFTSNDMELGIETIVKGNIAEKGIVAIDAKLFSDVVRKLPDNEVIIETDDKYITTITCEKAKFNLIGKSGEDFSYLPSIEKNEYISLSQFMLKEIITKTIFSISDNDTNKIMTGELFEIIENQLKVASLDGHRISIRKVELDKVYENKKIIIPGKTLNEISKILSGEADKLVKMYITDNHVVFDFDNTTVVSRLIEGEYFSINQMISPSYDTKITINKKEFISCIDRSTLLCKEGDKKPIIVTISDGILNLKINSVMGSMNEDIDIAKEGKDIAIGFNPKFLMDALRAIEDEQVDIYFVNPKAPCFIKNDKETYTYLVLPVNFNVVS
ncbi:MAG: DNA polymerase III subunit beta [Lachnospiraceae bacterium]|nr:DNA polymerase III subunit beta [Lachnospiraceae bacterium]